MKRLLLKSVIILIVISATVYFIAQLYPEAYKGLFKSKEFAHSRTTTIQVYSSSRKNNGLSLAVTPYDHKAFLNTQITLMLSDEFLDKLITDYQLAELRKRDQTELPALINQQLKLSVNNADLIEIKTFAHSDEQAQQLAYAITMSYRVRRISDIKESRKKSIKVYHEKIKHSETQVLKKRKAYKDISKKLGIPYDTENQLQPLPEDFETIVPSKKDRIIFTTAKDDYERDFRILQSIKFAELNEAITDMEIISLSIHKRGWTPEIEVKMKARRVKP